MIWTTITSAKATA